jgi:hypothetical protein
VNPELTTKKVDGKEYFPQPSTFLKIPQLVELIG